MIATLLVALGAALASPPAAIPPTAPIEEARKAITAGRLDQARIMIARAMAAGANGEPVDRALADLAFAAGHDAEAIARYRQLLASHPDDAVALERAGISALRAGEVKLAAIMMERATDLPGASWRAWNARGAIADLRHDWPRAEAAYEKAAQLAPGHAEILNNRGWSLILRGEWTDAVAFLERAAALDPKSARIANNLELARAALSAELPRREPGEPDRDWAARLNDAGVAAQLLGDKKRALAAFSQALEASGSWYERAANNLQALSGQ